MIKLTFVSRPFLLLFHETDLMRRRTDALGSRRNLERFSRPKITRKQRLQRRIPLHYRPPPLPRRCILIIRIVDHSPGPASLVVEPEGSPSALATPQRMRTRISVARGPRRQKRGRWHDATELSMRRVATCLLHDATELLARCQPSQDATDRP